MHISCLQATLLAGENSDLPAASIPPTTGAAVLRMLRAWANRDNKQMPLPTFETVPGATPKQVCWDSRCSRLLTKQLGWRWKASCSSRGRAMQDPSLCAPACLGGVQSAALPASAPMHHRTFFWRALGNTSSSTSITR